MQTSSRIDEQIVRLIAERGRFVAQAAAFKKNAEGVRDTKRVEAVIQRVRRIMRGRFCFGGSGVRNRNYFLLGGMPLPNPPKIRYTFSHEEKIWAV